MVAQHAACGPDSKRKVLQKLSFFTHSINKNKTTALAGWTWQFFLAGELGSVTVTATNSHDSSNTLRQVLGPELPGKGFDLAAAIAMDICEGCCFAGCGWE